ncbi:unnamed protein product [Caenorhabditis angaria]|uniref:Uncharacterized protein n=1 Tax=Caenorhabditis angaria TaxID=860376 RepID=A0A9P1I4J6_9PELO|nr:unnamed protein product [Caenorhabditis angaria]
MVASTSASKTFDWPVFNQENFSRMSIKSKQHVDEQNVTIERNVGGENDGRVYKIKADKTPFIIRCLSQRMDSLMSKSKEKEEEEKEKEGQSTSGTCTQKRSIVESTSNDETVTKKSK